MEASASPGINPLHGLLTNVNIIYNMPPFMEQINHLPVDMIY